MTRREIAVIAIKLLGLYVLFQSLDSLTGLLQPLFTMADVFINATLAKRTGAPSVTGFTGYFGITSNLFVFLIKFATGLGLFVFARRVGDLFVDEKADMPLNVLIGARELQTIAFSVVGLILLLQAGPYFIVSAIGKIINFFSWNANLTGGTGDPGFGDQFFWFSGLRILIALHLLGLRGVIQLLRGGRIIMRFEKPVQLGEISENAAQTKPTL